MDNRPAENVLPKLSAISEAPGSWVYVRRGQPNEETDCKSSCRCQGGPSDGKDYWKTTNYPRIYNRNVERNAVTGKVMVSYHRGTSIMQLLMKLAAGNLAAQAPSHR